MTPLQDWIVPVTVDGEHIALTGDKAIDILRGVFHLPDFRGCQRKAVQFQMDKILCLLCQLGVVKPSAMQCLR